MRDRPEPKISHAAAYALYEKMTYYDNEVSQREKAVKSAMAAMTRAHATAQDFYAKRSEIAKELDRLAPDDFMPPEAAVEATGRRFWRPNPLPPFDAFEPQYKQGFAAKKALGDEDDQF